MINGNDLVIDVQNEVLKQGVRLSNLITIEYDKGDGLITCIDSTGLRMTFGLQVHCLSVFDPKTAVSNFTM